MKIKTNKISDIRKYYLHDLSKIYDSREAGVLMDMIFEAYTGLTRVQRCANPEKDITEKENVKIRHAMTQLLQNKPVQYVLHRASFCGLKFFVDERVLIPRPETEELVYWILADQEGRGGSPAILEIGTGSGCIAVSLKKNLPDARVFGTDISDAALEVAVLNATNQQTEITFIHHDIFDPDFKVRGLFDIIVSNPPYVRMSEKAAMHRNVLDYEPGIALFVDDNDPLVFYTAIADIAFRHLVPGGSLYLEINEIFGNQLIGLLTSRGLRDVTLRKDQNDRDRMIRAYK